MDVANAAGVSKITASRAISNPSVVTEATRRKVHEAAARIGYVQNFVAGSLKSKRSRLIACVVPTIASASVFLPAVRAMTQAFERLGYHVMLSQRGYGLEQESEQIETVLARRPDGIVLTGTFASAAARRRLKASGLPVMEMWDMARSPIDMLVGFSHEAAGREAAAYLHGKGRRRIAMVSATEPRSAAREAGFVAELQRLGLSAPLIHSVAPPTRLGHGRQGLAALLQSDPRIDAVFCTTDMVALGVILEAQSRGLQVPGQLAVMGFGDMDFAADANPPLTTIHVDNEQLGERAAVLMVEALDGRRSKRVLDMGFQIVERASA
ncbi:LacI family DNA-binding transcriptional regulator [Pseudorhodoferax sp.]|uniref:LacI family DNA-binding transcriptional regulator n=1 Tax=Pseudorhodoferax sp. TaxID=1993553 RepID=UPI002DD678DB|nr:LacI family DNA-binding transcriptional regulator [Pseudorhodoferax sp.]